MRFEYNDSTYSIKFKHSKAASNGSRSTQCDLFKDAEQIGQGYANCVPTDQFCKETGRKISLTRALYALDDKQCRKTAWDAYRSRKTQGKGA